jgi:hypothetical protein
MSRESKAEDWQAPPSDDEQLQRAIEKIERVRAGLMFERTIADIDRVADGLRKAVREGGRNRLTQKETPASVTRPGF